MAKVLLTGASGFVGSHVLPALLDAGHHVVALCRSEKSGAKVQSRVERGAERLQLHVGDVEVVDSSRLRQVIRDKNIVVGVIAVPAAAAQQAADELVSGGVRIIFNYSDALLSVPSDVTVHTSSPAVELLYALYFYLT